jgi:AraC family transcriptional regulator
MLATILSTLDPTQDDTISQFLPCPPLFSSRQLRWNGIHVQYHRQPAWETPNSCCSHHAILINYSEQPAKTDRILDGHKQSEQAFVGDITVIPAGVQHKASWTQETSFLLIFFDPAYVTQVSNESCNPDCVKIIPHFATSDPQIHQIGLLLKSELESNEPCSRLYGDSLANILTIRLLRRYSERKIAVQYSSSGLSKNALQRVIEYIHENLSGDLSLKELADLSQIGPNYFTTLFRQSTGLSAYQYVINCRIEKAKQLLASSELPLVEISLQVGFQSQSHFINIFRRQIGMTPKTYRAARK